MSHKRLRKLLTMYLPGAVLNTERDEHGDVSLTLADGRKFYSPSAKALVEYALKETGVKP